MSDDGQPVPTPDPEFEDCEEALAYWEVKTEADFGSRLLSRLQFQAMFEHLNCEEAVAFFKNAGLLVALDDAIPAPDGLSVAEFMAQHPGLEASDEDIAAAKEEFRRKWEEQQRKREAGE